MESAGCPNIVHTQSVSRCQLKLVYFHAFLTQPFVFSSSLKTGFFTKYKTGNTKLGDQGNTIASKSSTSQLSISTVWALKLPWGQRIQGVSTNQQCRAPQWQS